MCHLCEYIASILPGYRARPAAAGDILCLTCREHIAAEMAAGGAA